MKSIKKNANKKTHAKILCLADKFDWMNAQKNMNEAISQFQLAQSYLTNMAADLEEAVIVRKDIIDELDLMQGMLDEIEPIIRELTKDFRHQFKRDSKKIQPQALMRSTKILEHKLQDLYEAISEKRGFYNSVFWKPLYGKYVTKELSILEHINELYHDAYSHVSVLRSLIEAHEAERQKP